MQRSLSGILLVLACLPMAGCGGCESAEARMRRNALKSAPDEVSDDDAPPAALLAKAQPAEAKPETGTAADSQGSAAGPPAPPAGPNAPPAPPSAAQASAAAAAATAAPSSEEAPAGSATAAASPPAAPAKVAVAVQKPEQPLSPAEQRARSIENLRAIGQALLAHTQRTGALPTVGSLNAAEEHLLSWRVAILPDLGYGELYRQFRHNEPWDSAHNRTLLPLIPAEFVSPERFDETTNYLGLAAPGQAFHWWQPTPLEKVKDGLANSALVVEVDHAAAVPWTKPADFAPSLEEPRVGIAELRPEGAFALLGDGRVVSLATHLTNSDLVALFSVAGRDAPGLAATLSEPQAKMPEVAAPSQVSANRLGAATSATATAIPNVASAGSAPADAAPPASAPLAASAAVRLPGEPLPPSNPSGLPVPSAQEQAAARELFREVYGDRYERSKQAEERKQLAQFLLAEATKVSANPVHFYELLRITRDVAVAGGDAATAIQAVDLLVGEFNVNGLELRLKVLEDLAKSPAASRDAAKLAERAQKLLVETFDADQFDACLRAYDVLLECRRREGDRGSLARLQKQRQPLEAAQAACREAAAAAQSVRTNPDDRAACETLGKYLCFVKSRWAEGLPYLTRATEIKLRVIAASDLEAPASGREAYSLAEQYWELAEQQKQPFARGLQLRAAYYYQIALDRLLGGLEKVRAEQRIAIAREEYGDAEVARALGPRQTAAE